MQCLLKLNTHLPMVLLSKAGNPKASAERRINCPEWPTPYSESKDCPRAPSFLSERIVGPHFYSIPK